MGRYVTVVLGPQVLRQLLGLGRLGGSLLLVLLTLLLLPVSSGQVSGRVSSRISSRITVDV